MSDDFQAVDLEDWLPVPDRLSRVEELEAKLAKAVEALRFYAPSTVDYPGGPVNFVGGDDAGKRAAVTLIEIQKE